MEFSLSSSSLENLSLSDRLVGPNSGALVSFCGTVRNHNSGRAVQGLEYEAYADLCHSEMKTIFNEAGSKFAIHDAKVVHRTGRLQVGDMAVWIGVRAAHRDAAFWACRYLIDELKERLPIWKKEIYKEGDSSWMSAQTPSTAQFNSDVYYARQMRVPQIGRDGQRRLQAARVLVVGAGGLGCAALQGLAGSGIGTIGICEDDILAEHNLHRQLLYRHADIGRPKIELAISRLRELNPVLDYVGHPGRLDARNVMDVVSGYDCVIDATDNFSTKFLLNDACVLRKIPLVSASLHQTDGQLHTYLPGTTACQRCLWPEMPAADCVQNCNEAGVLGDLAAVFGHLQSLEAVKTILGNQQPASGTFTFDALHLHGQHIELPICADCPVCGSDPAITSIEAARYAPLSTLEKDIRDIPGDQRRRFTYVDVRQPYERALAPLGDIDCMELPFAEFTADPTKFQPDQEYLVFCSKGIRSLQAVQILRQAGFNNAYSLKNVFPEIKSALTQNA